MFLLEEVSLELDELEALRLADLEEMYQADAAQKMGISRQTFANIVARARHKVADALIHGKALKICLAPEGDKKIPISTNAIEDSSQ